MHHRTETPGCNSMVTFIFVFAGVTEDQFKVDAWSSDGRTLDLTNDDGVVARARM